MANPPLGSKTSSRSAIRTPALHHAEFARNSACRCPALVLLLRFRDKPQPTVIFVGPRWKILMAFRAGDKVRHIGASALSNRGNLATRDQVRVRTGVGSDEDATHASLGRRRRQ